MKDKIFFIIREVLYHFFKKYKNIFTFKKMQAARKIYLIFQSGQSCFFNLFLACLIRLAFCPKAVREIPLNKNISDPSSKGT